MGKFEAGWPIFTFGVDHAAGVKFDNHALRAQFDTASVVGTVRDQSGASIPGAKVTLKNTATSISLTRTTAPDGNYEFATVRPGMYLVTAEMTGFAMALTENVQVQVGVRMRVDMQLALC